MELVGLTSKRLSCDRLLFEFHGCLFGTIESLESFKYEIPMYQNLSYN